MDRPEMTAAEKPRSGSGQAILCFNFGSSSLKFSVYSFDNKTEVLLGRGKTILTSGTLSDSVLKILNFGLQLSPRGFAAIGHRVVHGGTKFTGPVKINQSVLKQLSSIIPFAPLHLPGSINIIRIVSEQMPKVPQVACFDTSFHDSLPPRAKNLAIPRSYAKKGVQKYGFHGLSCEYILTQLRKPEQKKLILLHLGNGSSITAIKNGKSLDTTMSLTPAGGLMMGTRSGELDPGVLIYLARKEKMTTRKMDTMINEKSGLLGVSELSSDMQKLLKAEKANKFAAEAIDQYCYRITQQVGAYSAILEGVHTLVFTGGIGENAPVIRARICRPLRHLGCAVDSRQNKKNAWKISAPNSKCQILVVPTDEGLMIARHAFTLRG